LGAVKGRNTTLQTKPIADELFNIMPYEAGIVDEKQGPKLPSELVTALWDAEFIHTGSSPSSDHQTMTIDFKGDSIELSEADKSALLSFLDSYSGPRINELQEAIGPLEIHTSDTKSENNKDDQRPATSFCNMADIQCQELAEKVSQKSSLEYSPESQSKWRVSFVNGGRINPNTDQFQVVVKFSHESGQQYFHKLMFSPQEGLNTVRTIYRQELNWRQRSELIEQRSTVIKSVISVLTEENIDIGNPMRNIRLNIEHGPSIEQFGNR